MLKNDKGITLISLVITIIVLIILASVATVSGTGAIDYIKFNNAKAQFETMQAYVNSWYEESKSNSDILNYGVDITQSDETIRNQTLKGENATGYRYFKSDYIKDTLDIDGISHDFLINISSRKVLLFGGITYNGKTYYSAEDFGINIVQYNKPEGTIGFDKSIEYNEDNVYLVISNIVIPENISKYEVKYKVDGDSYWTTLTTDKKNEEGSWKIPVTIGKKYNIEINTAAGDVKGEYTRVIPNPIDYLVESGDKVKEKITLVDENNDKITIPENFSLASDSAKLVKDGMVVVAPDESEFVWVPVEDINSMVMCQSHTQESNCNIIADENGNLTCENHIDTLICGKLYSKTKEDTFNSTLETQTYTKDAILREPDVLISTDHGDYNTSGLNLLKNIVKLEGTEDEIKTKWSTQLQKEFEEMAKYVYQNSGFYVGRYETSLKSSEDGEKNIAQSIGGKSSASGAKDSANTWYGLYQIEKQYSEDNNLTKKIGSSMIWGSQYDQIMIWMQNNEIDVTSTDSTNLKGAEPNDSDITGIEGDKDILNNIYDLLGCKCEWTLEANIKTDRVYRGGYQGSRAPSFRGTTYAYDTYQYASSRIILYIK